MSITDNVAAGVGGWIPYQLRLKRDRLLSQRREWIDSLRRLKRYFQGPTSRMNKPFVICLDIEAFEFDRAIITEIGWTQLDLSDERLYGRQRIRGGYEALMDAGIVESRHLRIHERRHFVNERHIKGCPEEFDFGRSEWIQERDIAHFIADMFENATIYTGSTSIMPILVGHGVNSDIDFLRGIGLDILPFVSDCLDTADLEKAIRHDATAHSLSTLLCDYRIPARYLHNAGNDACYTMQLLQAQAFSRGLSQRDKDNKFARMQTEINKAKAVAEYKTRMQFEGWSDLDHD